MAYCTAPSGYFEDSAAHAGHKRLMCEGDCWFFIPDIANMPVQLESMLDAAILCVADSGDTLEDLAEDWQFKILQGPIHNDRWGQRWEAILLSAGGNNVIGPGIVKLLAPAGEAGEAGTDAGDVTRFLDLDKVIQMLATIKARLLALKRMRDASEFNSDTPIFVHTYNCLTPRNGGRRVLVRRVSGPWLWPHLRRAGTVDCEITKAFMKVLIDRFCGVLMEVQNVPNPRFVVIDSRDILAPVACKKGDTDGGSWRDEMHPGAKGFEKITREKFLPALRQAGILSLCEQELRGRKACDGSGMSAPQKPPDALLLSPFAMEIGPRCL